MGKILAGVLCLFTLNISSGQAASALDIDGDDSVKPLTDGLLILRHAFNFTGDALINNAIDPSCTRCTSELVESYIQSKSDDQTLDIDGDGTVKPHTDSRLLLRYLFGFRGDTLIADAVDDNATRSTATAIESYIESTIIMTESANVPYDIPKFKDVLDKSDLQWQSSLDGHYEIKKDLVGVSTDYFYLSNNGHMTFEIADNGQKRVELRQKQEWTIATDVAMSGSVQCFPPNALKEYTFMQVFNRAKNNPSARLLWHVKRGKKSNHLWAFVKTKDGERKVDLGANPEGLFDVDISIVNSELIIKINDIVKLTQSVVDDYYWDGDFYFKTGAYISGSINNDVPEGERGAKVEFESLNFSGIDR